MKVNYKGYIVEGNAEEIRKLVNGEENLRNERKKYVMTETHRKNIMKGQRRRWRLLRKKK